jgi:THO complex subunit 2
MSLLKPISSPPALTPSTLTTFLQSVQHGLPSSSASVDSASCEHFLVDSVWSIDLDLEDTINTLKLDTSDQSAPEPSQAVEKKEHTKEILLQFLQQLLAVGLVTPRICRERFEVGFAVSAGLLSDKVNFERREVRTRTHLFYRQNKFNLLREQTEGYSKLNSELTSNLGPPHSHLTGAPIESYAAIQQRARLVWRKVISLIGYFDLDPNRALDIILDVFSVTLGIQFSFFLALLSASPWAGNSTFPPAEVMPPQMSFHGKSIDEILAALDPEYDPSPPDRTPSVMAQVLGFKFAHYQSSDTSDGTPKQLYLTAALLIRERFITLEDLLPHLSPNDEGMNAAEKEYKVALRTRISGSKQNALAMAAPLESSAPSMSKPKPAGEPKKTEPRAKQNQRAGLLSALLAVGALRPAFCLISKHRWLVDAYPEVADLIIRILKYSTAPLYETTCVNKERRRTCNQPRPRYGSTGVVAPPPRKPILTYWAPTPPGTSTVNWVFFFPRWSERIPLCTTLQDLVDFVEPFLSFIGPLVSRDVIFVTKLLRLARVHLLSTIPIDASGKVKTELDETHPVCQVWYMMIRKYLLPGLSLVSGNAVFAVDVWSVVRLYPTTSRWRLYGEWRSSYQSHGELRVREAQCNTESRAILRRLSHQSIDALSGPVAKLAHSNPTIFFTIAINQICSYENLAEVVILALRCLTTMGLEVLVFVLLDALSNEDKERVKSDGVNISDWLQSLASFTGMLFRRYTTDLTPVLRYIVHQLHARQTSEITVLRELILKMAGIEPLPDLSDQQVTAMAGGPALRIEAVASKTRGARLEEGEAVLKAPQRLGKYLLDSNLALPLLIEVAQQRQSCVFSTNSAHLKSLSGLYDATHGVLCQYLELLTTPGIVSPQEYAARVLPDLGELGSTYGICAPICMQIIRPVLHARLLASTLSTSTEETEKRLKAEMIARKKPTPSRVASPAVNGQNNAEDTSDTKPGVENAGDDVPMAVDTAPAPVVPQSPWLPELSNLFDDIRKIVSKPVLDVIGIGFYTTFWQLSTYDLSPPLSKYEEEMASLKAASRAEDLAISHAERSSDRSLRQKASLFRQRRDRYNDYAQTLSQEAKDQSIMRTFTIRRMSREKQHWFAHAPKPSVFANLFIEHCLQPRCLLSPMDAEFCAQIIKVLQVQGTPGFPSLTIYDKLLGEHIKGIVFSCSEYEARNYGELHCSGLRITLISV